MKLPKTHPRRRLHLGLLAASMLALGSTGFSGELNHYQPGIFGTRDFFLPPAPGFYYAQMDFNYLSGEFHDGNGNKLDSLTISRSLDLSRTLNGSQSFGLSKSRSSSFTFNFQGSNLDLGAQLDTTSTATASLTLNAEATARLRARATVRARLDDLDVRITGIAPTMIWASESKILGARFGALVSLPIVDMSIDALVKGSMDVNARLNGQLTLNAIANLTGSATADGSLTVGGPRGKSIAPSGSKSVTAGTTRSGTVVKKFSTNLNVHRDFTLHVSDSGTGLGDLYVQPLWLDWSGDHYDIAIADGFYAPTGRYEAGALNNTGMGYWSNQTQLSAAIYPWKHRGTALTAAATYEVHGNKQDVDIRPGDTLTINWGLSQFLPLNKDKTWLAEVGFGGYDLFQVSDDRGRDVTYDAGVHDQVHAYGVQIGLAQTKWNATMTLRWMHEYGARDRFEGDMYVLNFAMKL